MDEIMNHLEKAYDMLSQISVSGNNVDRMAMAKQELRTAFQMLDVMKNQQGKEETDGQDH